MKAINITPEVYKMVQDLSNDGIDAARYTLEKALDPEKLQVFKEVDSNIFWFENHDAPKYAVNHVKSNLIRRKGYVYRDDWKENEKPAVVEVVEEPKDDKDLHLANPDDLKLFVKKYMKDYQMAAKFKTKEQLEGDDMKDFFSEISDKYTAGIGVVINAIYGGKKPNFRGKNKMNLKERKEFEANNREEFEWLLDNLIWLAKPSDKYLAEHKKFSTANYMKVSADLFSCVNNSLYHYRALKMF